MRVLIVTPDFPPAPGGIQILAHRIARHASALESRVVTIHAPGAERFDRDQAIDVRRAPALRRSHRASLVLLSVWSLLEAARFRPRVVLSMHIVTAPAAWLIARLLQVPFVQYLHAAEVDYRPRLATFAVGRAAATVAVSAHTTRLARQAGAPPARVRTIPPGVDLPDPSNEPRLERPTVITVARLEDRFKGHDVLLRSLPSVVARVPDAQWVVIGDGSLRDELERRAAELGLDDRVTFLGVLTDAERDRWLARAHVFAMPSRRPVEGGGEGFGIAFLEAGASGLPVVAGSAAGTPDAVADGETGVLVDPEDPAAVATAIADLLLDRDRAEALGRRGRERAREYAWPLVARQVERVVLELADR